TLPFVLIALASCGDALPQAADQDREAPVLGHIKSRHERVTVYASPAGPRFTVRDETGRALADGLSLDELKERHPALFDRYRKSYALDGSAHAAAPEPQPSR